MDTVAAQLLYEITGARYAGPDVTTRLDSIELTADGPDRVRISGVRGEPPPPTYKVSLNSVGGFRNEVTFVLTGLDLAAKADLVREQVSAALEAEPPAERAVDAGADRTSRTRRPRSRPARCCGARSRTRIRPRSGRSFSGRAVELALASYPGFHLTAPPGDASPYGVFTPAYVDADAGAAHGRAARTARAGRSSRRAKTVELAEVDEPELPEPLPAGPARRVPLGLVAGARSGDKGGNANVGRLGPVRPGVALARRTR